MTAHVITENALALSEGERAKLVDDLLTSLHRPDPRLDEIWAQEAKARITAFEAGQIEAIPAEEVFAEFER